MDIDVDVDVDADVGDDDSDDDDDDKSDDNDDKCGDDECNGEVVEDETMDSSGDVDDAFPSPVDLRLVFLQISTSTSISSIAPTFISLSVIVFDGVVGIDDDDDTGIDAIVDAVVNVNDDTVFVIGIGCVSISKSDE
jgi:hypothetical protein